MTVYDDRNAKCNDGKMEFCCHVGDTFDIFKFFAFAVKANLFGDKNENISEFAEKPANWNKEASTWIKAGGPVDDSDFRFPIVVDEINVQGGLDRRPSLAMEIGWNLAENVMEDGCDTCMADFDRLAKEFDYPDERIEEIMDSFREGADEHAKRNERKWTWPNRP